MPSLEFRRVRSEEHTSELQSHSHLVCRLLLEKKKSRSEEHTSELQSHSHIVCRLLLEQKKTPHVSSTHSHLLSLPLLINPSTADPAYCIFFFFNDPAPPEIYPLSLHDALPI